MLSRRIRSVLVGSAAGALLAAAMPSSAASPTWTPAGNMALARVSHQATLLADGRVLVTAGQSPSSGNGGYDTKLAEIYDPGTNAWSATGSTANGRAENVASPLADGRVLVAGGENANICTNDLTTEIYDPSTGTWSFSGESPPRTCGGDGDAARQRQSAGGGRRERCGSVFSEAELYDPGTGTWSLAPDELLARVERLSAVSRRQPRQRARTCSPRASSRSFDPSPKVCRRRRSRPSSS